MKQWIFFSEKSISALHLYCKGTTRRSTVVAVACTPAVGWWPATPVMARTSSPTSWWAGSLSLPPGTSLPPTSTWTSAQVWGWLDQIRWERSYPSETCQEDVQCWYFLRQVHDEFWSWPGGGRSRVQQALLRPSLLLAQVHHRRRDAQVCRLPRSPHGGRALLHGDLPHHQHPGRVWDWDQFSRSLPSLHPQFYMSYRATTTDWLPSGLRICIE